MNQDEKIFQKWKELQDETKTKDDVDALLMVVRLTRFYAKVLAESNIIRGELKKDIIFIHSGCNSFINRFRAGIIPAEREAFEKKLDKDFYPWGTIIQGLTYMNDEECEAVERFVVGIATGQIEAKVENGTELIINNEKL